MSSQDNKPNSGNSQWWKPKTTDYIMLTIAVITLTVSIITQTTSILNNVIKLGAGYKALYPLLNAFQLFVILYAIYKMRDIKQLLPDSKDITNDTEYKNRAEKLVGALEKWIRNHVGKANYEECQEYKDGEMVIKADDVKRLITNTNKNINKLYTYWSLVWAWLFVAYVIEFISSLPGVNSELLAPLVILFNNIVTIYWYYIYRRLNLSNRKIVFEKGDIQELKRTREYLDCEKRQKIGLYNMSRFKYRVERCLDLSYAFGKTHKYREHEEGDNEKYATIRVHNGWKIWPWLAFVAYVLLLILDRTITWAPSVLWLRRAIIYYIPMLFGACAMLAAFSRLGSGFLKVPLSALLIMLFYSAVQPLFFTGEDLNNTELNAGQMLFIINFVCLIGKFALLYIIRWTFSDYRIAYYFIYEQLHKKTLN